MTEQLKPGWEFTIPGWVVKPYNWILAILIVITLIISILLLSKMQAVKSNQAGTQPLPQVTNPK